MPTMARASPRLHIEHRYSSRAPNAPQTVTYIAIQQEKPEALHFGPARTANGGVMEWFRRALLPGDSNFATERPAAFVLAKTWQFATGFTFVHVVAVVVIPGWTDITYPHLLFVAVVSGLMTGLTYLGLARSAPSGGSNAAGSSVT